MDIYMSAVPADIQSKFSHYLTIMYTTNVHNTSGLAVCEHATTTGQEIRPYPAWSVLV